MSRMEEDLYAALLRFVARYPNDPEFWPEDVARLISSAWYLLRLLEVPEDAK